MLFHRIPLKGLQKPYQKKIDIHVTGVADLTLGLVGEISLSQNLQA